MIFLNLKVTILVQIYCGEIVQQRLNGSTASTAASMFQPLILLQVIFIELTQAFQKLA
jgi:hypothetical protein